MVPLEREKKKKIDPGRCIFQSNFQTSFSTSAPRTLQQIDQNVFSFFFFFTLFNKSTETSSSSFLRTSKMSGAQYHWTDHLNVPRTEEEWKAFASKAQFELSAKQRINMINQKKRAAYQTSTEREDCGNAIQQHRGQGKAKNRRQFEEEDPYQSHKAGGRIPPLGKASQ